MAFARPKGTEDFYPSQMAIRSRIFDSLRNTSQKYGYREVSTPAFESLGLLSKKEGEEIKEQIFTLEKRSKEEFGLRFDLTVPLTRMFMEQQKSLSKPVRWFALDRMWRYERPQKGRMREFYQLSVELFGADSLTADAEIVSLALDCLIDLGLTEKDIVLKLNDRKLLQALLLDIIPKGKLEAVIRLIDKRAKIPAEVFADELKKEGIDKVSEIESLLDSDLSSIDSSKKEVRDALASITTLLELLGDKKKYVEFDLSTARGLSYYTGIVFEVFDRTGKYRSILGGGRYDNLVEMFGGQPTPATGFGIGYSTLSLLLEDKGLISADEAGPDYFIGALSEGQASIALKLATKLRKKSTVEVDVMGRNVGNQLKYANKIKARKVIIIGEDEAKSGSAVVKDLETGKEEKISL